MVVCCKIIGGALRVKLIGSISLIADPGVVSSIPARPHTFVEIDHEIFCTVILLFLLIQEGLLYLIVLIPDLCTLTYSVVSYKQKYLHG